MPVNLFPTLSYILISTFTPGPSNLSTTSVAMQHGYQKSIAYQLGLAAGVFAFMFATGLISTTLMQIFPTFEPILRYAGAMYLLYLAWSILNATYHFTEQPSYSMGFGHGFMLNILNPKLFIYAFTLFTSFLASITSNPAWVVVAAFLLAATSFVATSIWALFGSVIKNVLHNRGVNIVVNLLLALTLCYSAISLIGLAPF